MNGSKCRKGKKYPMRHLVPKRRKGGHSKSAGPREIRVANAEARSREVKEKAREMKTVFVFSDLGFDQVIKMKYEECGYGTCVPQMVFWNLRESRSTPVIGMQKGAALMSWYPEEVMMAAISGPEYQNLQAVD